MTKTFCDCCGEEVEHSHMHITFSVHTNFMRRGPATSHKLDICQDCHADMDQDGQRHEHMVTVIGKLAVADAMETED